MPSFPVANSKPCTVRQQRAAGTRSRTTARPTATTGQPSSRITTSRTRRGQRRLAHELQFPAPYDPRSRWCQVPAPSPHQAEDRLTSSSTAKEDTEGTTSSCTWLHAPGAPPQCPEVELESPPRGRAPQTREGIAQQGRDGPVLIAPTTQPGWAAGRSQRGSRHSETHPSPTIRGSSAVPTPSLEAQGCIGAAGGPPTGRHPNLRAVTPSSASEERHRGRSAPSRTKARDGQLTGTERPPAGPGPGCDRAVSVGQRLGAACQPAAPPHVAPRRCESGGAAPSGAVWKKGTAAPAPRPDPPQPPESPPARTKAQTRRRTREDSAASTRGGGPGPAPCPAPARPPPAQRQGEGRGSRLHRPPTRRACRASSPRRWHAGALCCAAPGAATRAAQPGPVRGAGRRRGAAPRPPPSGTPPPRTSGRSPAPTARPYPAAAPHPAPGEARPGPTSVPLPRKTTGRRERDSPWPGSSGTGGGPAPRPPGPLRRERSGGAKGSRREEPRQGESRAERTQRERGRRGSGRASPPPLRAPRAAPAPKMEVGPAGRGRAGPRVPPPASARRGQWR